MPRNDRALASVQLGLDRRLGAIVSGSVLAHHRRRLRRVGRESALDAESEGWAEGTWPPRDGCAVEVLIDGAEVAPRMAADLSGARSHVYLAGWFFSPEFALVRGETNVVLRNLLAELAERVDVHLLVWAGAPLPLFRPSRRMVRQTMEELCSGTKIKWAADARERPLHCHHEKTIVVDDRVAFVGGMDLTLESGDRFDDSAHIARAQLGWHDIAARLEGPVVADVSAHFRMRWKEVTGEQLSATSTIPPSAGSMTAQLVRTVPERVYSSLPHGEFSVLESYLRALRSARAFVYLENQFLWSPEIANVLCDKLARPPSEDFRLVLVLPARPNSGADDTRGVLAELLEADNGSDRLVACTIYARHARLNDPVYVHAKIGIVDDTWLTVGSANLNEHSLFNDTEMNLVCRDPELARSTRLRLWSEHLELPEEELGGTPSEVVDRHWKPTAREQLARLRSHEPLTHRLVELQGLSRRSERLLGPLQGLLVDG